MPNIGKSFFFYLNFFTVKDFVYWHNPFTGNEIGSLSREEEQCLLFNILFLESDVWWCDELMHNVLMGAFQYAHLLSPPPKKKIKKHEFPLDDLQSQTDDLRGKEKGIDASLMTLWI